MASGSNDPNRRNESTEEESGKWKDSAVKIGGGVMLGAAAAGFISWLFSDSTETPTHTRIPRSLSVRAEQETECAICFDKLESVNECVFLPCSHRYHKFCISQYINKTPPKPTIPCPTCRSEIDRSLVLHMIKG